MNTKTKGDIAVAHAIADFSDKGFEVLLPLGDKQSYDLVVDDGGVLRKVQVKYAGIQKRGCIANLETRGGNQSFSTASRYTANAFDLLYIYSENKSRYIIPWVDIYPCAKVTVSSTKYDNYKLI